MAGEKSKSPRDIRVTVSILLKKYGRYLYSAPGTLIMDAMSFLFSEFLSAYFSKLPSFIIDKTAENYKIMIK